MEEIIIYVLIGLIVICVLILVGIFVGYLGKLSKDRKNNSKPEPVKYDVKEKPSAKGNVSKASSNMQDKKKPEAIAHENNTQRSDMKNVTVDFVENFMEFDEISDNMIIQNNGSKFIMVIKCQGINYDLMSEAEMVAIEEGFIQFLNTLRFPIQFYIQTSSLDLSDSIREYNERTEEQYQELMNLEVKLKRTEEFDEDNEELIDELKYEIRRKRNIYEYGKDVILNIERISKNKSILKQNYYIVVPYFSSELGTHSFSKDEVQEMAFSELYTRCNGLISALKVCSVEGALMNSFDLAELLHLAYNRDEGEIFSFRNAVDAEYDRLYHTGPDVLDKRIAMLEQEINEIAAANANEKIVQAAGFLPGNIEENNEMIQKLIYENQREYIKDYEEMIPSDIIKQALMNSRKDYKEGKLHLPSDQVQEKKTYTKKQLTENNNVEEKQEVKKSEKQKKKNAKKKQDKETLILDVGGDEE